MIFRKLLSILLGFVVIMLLGSILAHLHQIIYPRSYSMAGHTDLTGLDIINFIIKAAYICLCCTLGGMITTLVGRSHTSNLIIGIILTVLITWTGIRQFQFQPIWFFIALIIFITPSVLLGYKIMKK